MPVPLPKQYLLGIDVQKRDFERFSRPSYLRGTWKEGGWWYYYLYGMAVKVPHGTQALFLLALGSYLIARCGQSAGWRDDLVLLAPAVLLLVLVSSQTQFNHHLRYVLPVFPLLFVWMGQVVQIKARAKLMLAITVALMCSVGSSLRVYPHALSYFNELAGRPEHGHVYLLHSNLDRGQDLIYLKEWMEKHPEARPLYLAYYGYLDPRHIEIDYGLPTPQLPLDATQAGPPPIEPGWYCVSINFLRGYRYKVHDGQGGQRLLRNDAYTWLRQVCPVQKIGYSIYVYCVTQGHTNHMHHQPFSFNEWAISSEDQQVLPGM